jgi:hypothetical protein
VTITGKVLRLSAESAELKKSSRRLRGFAQNAPEINSAVIGEISRRKKVFPQDSADFR